MSEPTVQRFVGVYNANGTLRGELTYWFGKRLGTAHCALCDITHGTFRERGEWVECRSELPAPFVTFHLDDQPDEIRQCSQGAAPTVCAETAVGVVMLLGPDELEECAASVTSFVDRLRTATVAAGLAW